MRIRDLKVVSSVAMASGLVLLGLSCSIFFAPPIDLKSRPVAKWQPSDGLGLPAEAAFAEQTAFAAALERPLFRVSRKPFDPATASITEPSPEPPPETPPPEPPPDMQLTIKGVLLDGANKQALIASPEMPDGIWLSQGAEIAGWKLVKLDENGAALAMGANQLELKLYVDNPANRVGSP